MEQRHWITALVALAVLLASFSYLYRRRTFNADQLANINQESHAAVVRQCKLNTLPFDDIDTTDNDEWLDLKLRLNSSQSGIFPFPKVYTSDAGSVFSHLKFAPIYQLHVQHENENKDSWKLNTKSENILNRYCAQQNKSPSSENTSPSDSTVTTVLIHNVYVTYTTSHLLATSDSMRKLIQLRTAEEQANAQYIDDEMYSLSVSQAGVVHIRIHSSIHSNRALTNAFASLDQLVNQVVPVQLPLSIIDWPDNHWRGK